MNIKTLFNKNLNKNEDAVSPIVATLVLVVVAIAGATAVGMILGTFSNDVSSQTNSENIATSASSEIIVAGSSTVQPVSEKLATEYRAKNPGVKVTVQAGGSGAGIASAGLGIVDIGAASKYMKAEEKEKFPDLQEHVIGGSAVVVFRNNVSVWTANHDTVTKEELIAMYNSTGGQAIKFNGHNAPAKLLVYQRSEASGTEETFAEAVLGTKDVNAALDVKDNSTEPKSALGNQGVISEVAKAKDPAIGFADYGLVADAIKEGKPLVILKINYNGHAVSVSDSNVKSSIKLMLDGKTKTETNDEIFPVEFCRPLVYLTNGEPSSVVKNFIQFAQSPGSIDEFKGVGYYSIVELQ